MAVTTHDKPKDKENVYCTLLIGDSYLLGALVVARSLRDAKTERKLAVLVPMDSISKKTASELEKAYDYVIDVQELTNDDSTALEVMSRPDLASTFTKIALWKQTQFHTIVYLDADTLPVRAPEELFGIDAPFAAAPEVGYPDCFNSGVMLLRPCQQTYKVLLDLALRGESFDGGDQGLLNKHFPEFHRLSFLYNMELYKTYKLYMPAVNVHRDELSVVHFIGKEKPWHQREREVDEKSEYSVFYSEMIDRWWAVHDKLSL